MDPWTDVHYVQLQVPDGQHPNRVVFGSDVFEPPGYLAYSANGMVQVSSVAGRPPRRSERGGSDGLLCRGSWCTGTTAARKIWTFCRRTAWS